jgi:hypothetical protein
LVFIESVIVKTGRGIQGRIQDLWLGGTWVGEGSGSGRGPWSSGGLRNYRHLFERQFWTNHTIFIRPKKTWIKKSIKILIFLFTPTFFKSMFF